MDNQAPIIALAQQALQFSEPLVCMSLAVLGAASVAVSTKFQSLSTPAQFVISCLVGSYICAVGISTRNRWMNPAPLAPVPLVKFQKTLCLLILVWVWNIATVQRDFFFSFGVAILAVQLLFLLRQNGYLIRTGTVLPAFLGLVVMFSFHFSGSHLGIVTGLVALVTFLVMYLAA